jgi:hypothetical protein
MCRRELDPPFSGYGAMVSHLARASLHCASRRRRRELDQQAVAGGLTTRPCSSIFGLIARADAPAAPQGPSSSVSMRWLTRHIWGENGG